MVNLEWLKTLELRPDMNLLPGDYQVMPNHFHGIVMFAPNEFNAPTTGNGDSKFNNNCTGAMPRNIEINDDRTDAMRDVQTRCIASLQSNDFQNIPANPPVIITMDSTIKNQLIKHLQGGEAFLPIEKILEKFTFQNAGIRMHGLPYSAYEMFYHIVFAQKDILDFCVADTYETRKWPDDYWPENVAPGTDGEWEDLKKSYFADREALVKYTESNDLTGIVKHGKNQTLV